MSCATDRHGKNAATNAPTANLKGFACIKSPSSFLPSLPGTVWRCAIRFYSLINATTRVDQWSRCAIVQSGAALKRLCATRTQNFVSLIHPVPAVFAIADTGQGLNCLTSEQNLAVLSSTSVPLRGCRLSRSRDAAKFLRRVFLGREKCAFGTQPSVRAVW